MLCVMVQGRGVCTCSLCEQKGVCFQSGSMYVVPVNMRVPFIWGGEHKKSNYKIDI